MTKYIICDIDGCLIDSAWIWDIIRDYKIEVPERWDFFNRNANAQFNKIDKSLLNYLFFKLAGGFKILFLTARSEAIETETINFIQERAGLIYGKHFIVNFRPADDALSSVESKRARLDVLLESGKQIELAIDDEPAICGMYVVKNIPVIRWQIGMLPIEVIKQYGANLSYLTGEEALCPN